MARTVDSRFVRVALLAVTLLLAGSLVGCNNQEKADQTAAEQPAVEAGVLTAEQTALVHRAAEIALAIQEAPATAAAVLAKYEMTAEDFEEMMFQISANEQLTAAYEAALH